MSPVQCHQTHTVSSSHNCSLSKIWHQRLGHPGISCSLRLDREPLLTGIDTLLSPCQSCQTPCEACLLGKQCRLQFGISSRPASQVLERIHLDTVGPISPPALTGERYWVTAVDEFSHQVAVLPVHTKDAIPHAVQKLLLFWQRQRERPIKCVRSDRGTEFMNQHF